MTNWVLENKKAIIRSAFLVPILAVAAISISHVVSWYDLANPLSWAIYLSIAVEVAAMSAIAASSVHIKGYSVWIVFIIVTLIQFIGNIFFSYSDIDVNSTEFKNWSELTSPVFEAMGSDVSDLVAQRRWLALLEGGLLPLISLTCLHFFIKYGEIDNTREVENIIPEEVEEVQESLEEALESTDDLVDVETIDSTEQVEPEPSDDLIFDSDPHPITQPVQNKRNSTVMSNKMKKIHKLND